MKSNRIVAVSAFVLMGSVLSAQDGTSPRAMPQGDMPSGGMAHMAGHMYMTKLRAKQPSDQEAANAVVAKVKAAIAPYVDYHKALAGGFQIFMPNVQQRQYHFTNYANAREARVRFDPAKPTSLLYKKDANGVYKLVGVMYTDRLQAPEGELNERIPLSVARWHQHINFCQAPRNQKSAYIGPHAKFGLQGSIVTAKECEQAGGTFRPHLFGWMVHLYPFETDPKKIWSVDNDEEGHDNMEHSAMPGMQMN